MSRFAYSDGAIELAAAEVSDEHLNACLSVAKRKEVWGYPSGLDEIETRQEVDRAERMRYWAIAELNRRYRS